MFNFFYIFFFFLFFFLSFFIFFFFFFFQAEDGIRDADVTGVQTCALPISTVVYPAPTTSSRSAVDHSVLWGKTVPGNPLESTGWIGVYWQYYLPFVCRRSEERRVGKECRSRWSP